MMNYLYIGAIVGSIITIERTIYKWDELIAGFKENGGLFGLGELIGFIISILINTALWPVTLINEVKEFIGMK